MIRMDRRIETLGEPHEGFRVSEFHPAAGILSHFPSRTTLRTASGTRAGTRPARPEAALLHPSMGRNPRRVSDPAGTLSLPGARFHPADNLPPLAPRIGTGRAKRDPSYSMEMLFAPLNPARDLIYLSQSPTCTCEPCNTAYKILGSAKIESSAIFDFERKNNPGAVEQFLGIG